MPSRYQDTYPDEPLLESTSVLKPSASELLRLDFFEAQPAEMPTQVYEQHHILINLRDEPMRVENWRDDEHRDFIFRKYEIVVTPAGIQTGWKWHEQSKVIVVTLDPIKLEKFAQSELGVLLTDVQLRSIDQFVDEDICRAGLILLEALQSDMGSDVMFEGMSRVFLTKLIQKYGLEVDHEANFDRSFTSSHYKRVLDHVAGNFQGEVTLERLAQEAGLSPSQFSRSFKKTLGTSPYQFVMNYRVEKSKELLRSENTMIDIALSCGFADQAHFSRVFKKIEGQTPKAYRKAMS